MWLFVAKDVSGNRLNGKKDPEENSIRPRPIVINNGLFEDAEPMGKETGKFSFIYDMHGNVVKKFDNETNIYYVFEYDADNKLVYAEKVKDGSLELKAKYTYDGLGRRIEKEVIKGSSVTRKSYIYNGDNIFLEYNTAGTMPVESARYIGSGAIDDNLMTIRNGKGFFYHKDHLGSISAITNESGEVVQSSQYSSFGKIISIKDKERKDLGISKALDQPFYYTGREWDSEIELYYYRARSYDPNLGRFIQKDPIGLEGGDINFYRYVKNNPIDNFDPTGLVLKSITLPGIGATYLDDSIMGNINRWIEANSAAGINIKVTEAFRTSEYQKNLSKNPNAITPASAGSSLHEAGFAVDISIRNLTPEQLKTVVKNAAAAGISWGGTFKTSDPVHFFIEVPGGSANRSQYINSAQTLYNQITNPNSGSTGGSKCK